MSANDLTQHLGKRYELTLYGKTVPGTVVDVQFSTDERGIPGASIVFSSDDGVSFRLLPSMLRGAMLLRV